MRKLAFLLALAIPFAAAQGQTKTTPNAVFLDKAPGKAARVFAIKNGDPEQIAAALRMAGANASVDRRLKMVVVSAEPSLLSDMADIVQKLDVPAPAPKSIEITAYLIQASPQAAESGPVPTDLEPALKQFRTMFNYQGFKLLDSPILRSREAEEARVGGALSLPATNPVQAAQNRYDLTYRPSVVGDRIIRLERFRIGGQLSSIVTDLEFTDGQKIVVGKSGLEGGDRALIVVLTGRIVQ
ncbi:MAG TPA: hypothetical protein VN428_07400 [Bryobacteraceae bacterium]|nr:hypothetical protein [Bryobacteraceae bacterium]